MSEINDKSRVRVPVLEHQYSSTRPLLKNCTVDRRLLSCSRMSTHVIQVRAQQSLYVLFSQSAFCLSNDKNCGMLLNHQSAKNDWKRTLQIRLTWPKWQTVFHSHRIRWEYEAQISCLPHVWQKLSISDLRAMSDINQEWRDSRLLHSRVNSIPNVLPKTWKDPITRAATNTSTKDS